MAAKPSTVPCRQWGMLGCAGRKMAHLAVWFIPASAFVAARPGCDFVGFGVVRFSAPGKAQFWWCRGFCGGLFAGGRCLYGRWVGRFKPG
ncbi:MAG: hypothetical protein HC848_07635 [Limnobacter sp.]|nr:hypothetical protein [Limnobacter sp.]